MPLLKALARPARHSLLLVALLTTVATLFWTAGADARRHRAPNTTITSGPAAGSTISDSTATFTFTSSAANSTFQCKLDSGSYASCASPDATPTLSDGSHTFTVRAIDSLGYVDGSPASRTFTVDTAPPETTITSGPSGTITTNSASFAFTSSESNSSFQCSLDGASYGSCSSPKSYSSLADGSHAFSVRAIDGAGNTDATPATRSFAVDTSSSSSSSTTSSSIPTTWGRFASFETDLNSGTDYGWRVDSPFSVTRTNAVGGADGSYAAKIVTNGGNGGCSCPRMTFEPVGPFGSGADIWMGGSWYVTNPSQLKWSRLMNLGHFEYSGSPGNWYLALLVKDDPTHALITARNYNTDSGESDLATIDIPANRWFSIDIHAKLSPTDGQALTEVYMDGQLVAQTTKRNMWSDGALSFYNAGLSYFYPGNGNTTVYFDEPRLKG